MTSSAVKHDADVKRVSVGKHANDVKHGKNASFVRDEKTCMSVARDFLMYCWSDLQRVGGKATNAFP